MNHSITNYQTSFRVEDPSQENFFAIQKIIYEWLGTKEKDGRLKNGSEFCFRSDWGDLYKTKSSIITDTFLGAGSKAWAVRYTHSDKELGPRRFWYSDVGLFQSDSEVTTSIRISFANHAEDLRTDSTLPNPTVPYFVRSILKNLPVYSGRKEFRLLEAPVTFNRVGQGKLLADFISSPSRRYPLIVFNGDSERQLSEAKFLAIKLTGKCQVAIIAENPELAIEIQHYSEKEYRVGYGKLRVFFPFSRRENSFTRHRWYDVSSPEYRDQREGIITGLLRNNALMERDAVETVFDIRQLITRSKLMKLRNSTEAQNGDMDEFYKLFEEVENQRDEYKLQSEQYALEVDSLEEQTRQLNWRTQELQHRLDGAKSITPTVKISNLLPSLPENLEDIVRIAPAFYQNLSFSNSAMRSAKAATDCECTYEAWEILGLLNNTLHPMKFEDSQSLDLELRFGNVSRYKLAMSEGSNTKKDSRLMAIREIEHEGQTFDITPHIKHGNRAPKMLRIHFAFDEECKRIVIGFIGSHMENATSRKI